LLDKDWHFINEEVDGGELPGTSTHGWDVVDVPHDWAISGEFDKNNDIQTAAVIEDGEWVPRVRTGRTGGLPHVGIGWYRKNP
jgi:beta-galactosidase